MKIKLNILNAITAVKSKWYFVAGCLSISALVAAAYIYFTPALYKAEATVKVAEQTNPSSRVNKSSTDAEVLKSRNMIEKAIAGSDLNVAYYSKHLLQTKEMFTNSPIKVRFKTDAAGFVSQSFNIELNDEQSYSIKYQADNTSLSRDGSFGKELDLGFVKLVVEKTSYYGFRKTDGNTAYAFTTYSAQALAQELQSKNYINVTPVGDNSGLVKIAVTYPDAAKASKLANAIAFNYGRNEMNNNEAIVSANLSVINAQLEATGNDINKIQSDINAYKFENKIVDMPQETQAGLQTLGQLQVQKVDADMQIAALDNMSEYMRSNRHVNNIAPEYGTVNDLIYTETLLKLNDKAKDRQRASDAGQDVAAIDKEINALKDNLAESIRNTRKKLAVKQEELAVAITTARNTILALPEKQGELQQLDRNLYLNQKVYDHLIEKRAETMVAAPIIPATAYVVDSAITPATPSTPSPVSILALALYIGFASGLTLIAVNSLFKSKISNRDELQQFTDIPFIANIENLGKKDQYIAEPFNNLCTRMLLMNQFAKTQVITVTSTQSGEGKTTVAHNLARAMAQLDKRVLMVDMNSINPELNQVFDVRSENSIADVYHNNLDLHEAISITSIPNVDLLKAGELKSGINTFLTSEKTGVIIDEIKKHYDAVIFDTPEVSNYMDAIPLMKLSDLNLYVVKANATSQGLLKQATIIKKDYNIENMYFVLNAMTQNRNHSGYVPTGKYRVLKARQQASNTVAFVPRMLKKAALWFY